MMKLRERLSGNGKVRFSFSFLDYCSVPSLRFEVLMRHVGRVDGLHVGGGITEDNAQEWIDAGAEKVRTSLPFPDFVVSEA